jgi:hypothetical protein
VKSIIDIVVADGVIVRADCITARHVTFARCGIPTVRVGVLRGIFGAAALAELTLLTGRRAA